MRVIAKLEITVGKIFPGQCHTVISNLAIMRIILNPFYNAAVYTAYSEPTMHCIHLVYIYIERERERERNRAHSTTRLLASLANK